mmetsp:Transcript_24348/g.73308  ORF Transcript_24348/g.73308 Transcript_24348/m.73308 type:complete len:345 (+) Transcript_24348:534-1568(+)
MFGHRLGRQRAAGRQRRGRRGPRAEQARVRGAARLPLRVLRGGYVRGAPAEIRRDVAAARRALRAAAVGVFKGAHAARRDAPLPEGGVVLLDRRGRVDQSARIPRAVDEIRGRRPFRSSGGAGELPRLQHGRLARERRRQRPGSDTTVARGVARGARAVPPARPGRARVVAVVAHERELDGRGRPPALRLRVHEEEGLRRQGRLLLVHPALARGDPAGPRVGRAEVLRVCEPEVGRRRGRGPRVRQRRDAGLLGRGGERTATAAPVFSVRHFFRNDRPVPGQELLSAARERWLAHQPQRAGVVLPRGHAHVRRGGRRVLRGRARPVALRGAVIVSLFELILLDV